MSAEAITPREFVGAVMTQADVLKAIFHAVELLLNEEDTDSAYTLVLHGQELAGNLRNYADVYSLALPEPAEGGQP